MTLKKIAKIVRIIVEKNAANDGSISCWSDLSGACGYASYGLHKVLPESELVMGIYKGETHAWVELGDKIIDITATQFDIRDKVYIVKKGGKRSENYKSIHRGEEAIINISKWKYPDGWREPLVCQLKQETRYLTV